MNENMNDNIPVEKEEVVEETPVAAEEVLANEAPAEEVFADEAPVEEAPAEEAPAQNNPVAGLADKVKSLPVKYLALVAVAVVAVILALVLAFSVSASPLNLVGDSVENSLMALSENPAIALSDDVFTGGSVEVAVDMQTLMTAAMGYPMGEGTASVKLYADAQELKAALEAKVEMSGISLDAGAYLDEEDLAVASEALLGKEAYGINLKKLAKNFEESEFGPDGQYSLGVEMPEDVKIDQKQMAKIAEDGAAVYADLIKSTLKFVNKYADISKDTETLSFAGDKTKVTAVTISMDARQMSLVASDLVEYIRDEKAIRKYMDEVVETMVSVYDLDEEDAKQAIDELYERLDYICENELQNLEAYLEEMDVGFEMVFYIAKSGKQLVGVELEMEAEGEKMEFCLTAGPDLAELKQIEFSCDLMGEKYSATYEVTADDKKEFAAELRITDDVEALFEGSVRWDKKGGDFALEAYDGDDNYYLDGSLETSAKKTVIFVEKMGIEDGEEIELNTTVTLCNSDKVPSVPKYNDLLTMSAEEIQEVLATIEEAAMALGGGLLG